MKREGFTLVELLAVIVVLGIILVIAIPNVLNIIAKTKNDAYDRQKELILITTKKYVLQGGGHIVWNDNVATVYLKNLQDAALLPNPLKDPRGGNFNSDKTKVIIVKEDNEKYVYDLITEDSESGIGSATLLGIIESNLVSKNGSNYFVGSNPNNWIEFGQVSSSNETPLLWRIIKADGEGIKIIYEGKKNGSIPPVGYKDLDGSIDWVYWYNYEEENKYEGSDAKAKLISWYNSLYVIDKDKYVEPINWCIGAHTGGKISLFKAKECADSTGTGGFFPGLTSDKISVGMINTSDYISTSSSGACTSTSDLKCKEGNFLAKDEWINPVTGYWTLNAYPNYIFVAWAISDGELALNNCSGAVHGDFPKAIIPVVNLKTNILYKNGEGSLINPYSIKWE